MYHPAKYTVYNPGSHMSMPVIFFIHGTPGDSSHVDIYCSDFIEKGHTVIAWSRPGYGAAVNAGDMMFAEQAADGMRLLDDLGATCDVVLYGVGSGVGVVLEMCSISPDRFSIAILESPIFSTYRHSELNMHQRLLDSIMYGKIGHRVLEWICKISPMAISVLLLYRYSTLSRRQIFSEARAISSNKLAVGRLGKLLSSARGIMGGTRGHGNDLVELAIDRSHLIPYLPDELLVIHGDSDIESSLMESDKIIAVKSTASRAIISGGSHMLPISSRLVYVGLKKVEFVNRDMM